MGNTTIAPVARSGYQCEGVAMAQYAPTGGVLLVIGGVATVSTHDSATIVLVIVLGVLAYVIGVALGRRDSADGRDRA